MKRSHLKFSVLLKMYSRAKYLDEKIVILKDLIDLYGDHPHLFSFLRSELDYVTDEELTSLIRGSLCTSDLSMLDKSDYDKTVSGLIDIAESAGEEERIEALCSLITDHISEEFVREIVCELIMHEESVRVLEYVNEILHAI